MDHNSKPVPPWVGKPHREWLVDCLAQCIGIDFGGRSNGLDDFRRYVHILRAVIHSCGPWVTAEELHSEVRQYVAGHPFCRGEELVDALGLVAALEEGRLVLDLCVASERRKLVPDSLGSTGRRRFNTGSGPVDVEYFLPGEGDLTTAPVLFVLHGAHRDPGRYLDSWIGFGLSQGFTILAPHFSKTDFSGARSYNQGNVLSTGGHRRGIREWSFQVIEDVFDEYLEWVGSRIGDYAIYGHSAGAQFVHRMHLLCPQSRAAISIAANAGWYTFPSFEQDYPHGLGGLGVTEPEVSEALQRPLLLLVGGMDVDPDAPLLCRSSLAMEQGSHRLERGRHFHAAAEHAAGRLGVRLAWDFQVVDEVGHDQFKMALRAGVLLAENKK